MSRPAWSAREALAASAVAILLGGLVLMSLVVERGARTPSPASAAAVGGRRMVIGANNGRLADQRRTVEDLRDGDDPLSSSKRRVPNGPDPIHNSVIHLEQHLHGVPTLSQFPFTYFPKAHSCAFFLPGELENQEAHQDERRNAAQRMEVSEILALDLSLLIVLQGCVLWWVWLRDVTF
ncbi:unnamed protein product [Miscanthus lutarioriparius]|uniref:Uncharacterized protein n=1 Tax=Miscanthus lutarioriparius TaxID=422564 RepID=A0A811NED1_9POAL|nr:unnamed protein product [Miscanthus lutarioriparius]